MNPDRIAANQAAKRAGLGALKAGLPYTIEDDTRAVTVTIRYMDEADDEPAGTRWEEVAR